MSNDESGMLACECCDAGAALVITPGTFLLAVRDLVACLECVFGDEDWAVTVDNLSDSGRDLFIHQHGTFLRPGVPDEYSNWHNRGSLLRAFRLLVLQLEQKQFRILRRRAEGNAL